MGIREIPLAAFSNLYYIFGI